MQQSMQQNTLKALADTVISRSTQCNTHATNAQKPMQQMRILNAPSVASICTHNRTSILTDYSPGQQDETPRRIYKYRITDNLNSWMVVLTPGYSLDEARESLEYTFGARLLEVKEYSYKSARRICQQK